MTWFEMGTAEIHHLVTGVLDGTHAVGGRATFAWELRLGAQFVPDPPESTGFALGHSYPDLALSSVVLIDLQDRLALGIGGTMTIPYATLMLSLRGRPTERVEIGAAIAQQILFEGPYIDPDTPGYPIVEIKGWL